MTIKVELADYHNTKHAQDIVYLLNCYAIDPMGGGKGLPQEIKDKLIPELIKRSNAFSILAYRNEEPAGLANCFEGFSTFKARPLINIHDMVVSTDHRGHGISQNILAKVQEVAEQKNACKVTLEVLSKNEVAKECYKKFGFDGYELDPKVGQALFWEKTL